VTREQLEHLLRASAEIAADDEIVVIGSQAILGQFPDAPATMRVSTEADLFPLNHPDRAELIDGTIGRPRDSVQASGDSGGASGSSRQRARPDPARFPRSPSLIPVLRPQPPSTWSGVPPIKIASAAEHVAFLEIAAENLLADPMHR